MGRKHQKKAVDSTSGSNPIIDLKAIIHQNSQFFDKLVELIPAKFYLPNEDKERPWFSGLSKQQKASAKKESRENVKKARRDRLDPEKSSKTTVDLLKQSIEKEKAEDEDDVDGVDTKLIVPGTERGGKSVTYEELQQRLRSRIEQLRGTRNTRDPERPRTRPNDRDHPERKRKRDDSTSEEAKPNKNDDGDRKIEKDVEEASKELTFGYVKLGNDEENKKKKKRLSKEKELEKAKELQELKKDPVKGESISKKHSWKAAANRAAGIKVHDDPKLLKQSLTKEKKQRQKNAQKWKERVQTRDNMKLEKQQKRTENIVGRIQEKKNRRIAKREKKLMRPGFEGRKDGLVKEAASK